MPDSEAVRIVAEALRYKVPHYTAWEWGQRVVAAIEDAGWTLVRSDSWRLRSDFDVVPHGSREGGS